MRWKLGALGLTVALIVTACGLFPDLGGLRENGDGAPSDASPDNATDGGPDALPSSDAGDWCASQDAGYRLCADFDRSATAAQEFDLEAQNGVGGTFSLTTATFVSAPKSAVGIANPFAAGQTTGDRLQKGLWALGSTPPAIRCALQWDPVALSTTQNDYAHVVELALWSDDAATQPILTYSLNMQGDGQLIMLELYTATPSANTTHTITSSVTRNVWTQVLVSVDATTQMYSVTVGAMNSSGVLAKPLPSTSHGTLEVGPAYFAGNTTSSSPGWTFGYDNVICY